MARLRYESHAKKRKSSLFSRISQAITSFSLANSSKKSSSMKKPIKIERQSFVTSSPVNHDEMLESSTQQFLYEMFETPRRIFKGFPTIRPFPQLSPIYSNKQIHEPMEIPNTPKGDFKYPLFSQEQSETPVRPAKSLSRKNRVVIKQENNNTEMSIEILAEKRPKTRRTLKREHVCDEEDKVEVPVKTKKSTTVTSTKRTYDFRPRKKIDYAEANKGKRNKSKAAPVVQKKDDHVTKRKKKSVAEKVAQWNDYMSQRPNQRPSTSCSSGSDMSK